MDVEFRKVQSLGSDYIVIDNRLGRYDQVMSDLAFCRLMCSKNFGIGSIAVVEIGTNAEGGYEIRSVDADGKPGLLGGTPTAATVQVAKQLGLFKNNSFQYKCNGRNYITTFDQNTERFWIQFDDISDIQTMKQGYFLVSGYSQYVQMVDNVDTIDVVTLGRRLQNTEHFSQDQKGVVANFFQRTENDDLVKCRTYTQTTDAEIITCGSGSVAVAAVNEYLQIKHDKEKTSDGKKEENAKVAKVKFPGGTVMVSYTASSELKFTKILLGLPAKNVFKGTFPYDLKDGKYRYM